jgi:hypothetical protein
MVSLMDGYNTDKFGQGSTSDEKSSIDEVD